MREALWEVPEHLVRLDVVLLGEQPEVVRRGARGIEDLAGLTPPALARKAFGQPEGHDQERALRARQAVPRAIADEEAAGRELLSDGIDGAHHPFVVVADEAQAGEEQQRSIDGLPAERADERPLAAVVAAVEDRVADLTTDAPPSAPGDRPAGVLGKADPAVERHPAH